MLPGGDEFKRVNSPSFEFTVSKYVNFRVSKALERMITDQQGSRMYKGG